MFENMPEKRYSYSGENWEKRFKDGWGEERFPEPRLMRFIEEYGEEIGRKILDLGSGEGRHLIPLAKLGYDVTGLEYTQEGIKITREKEEKEGTSSKLVRGDFRDLPFKENSFDAIVCTAVLHHNNWEGAVKAFSEAAKVLKPNGFFFLRARSEKAAMKPGENRIKDKGITFSKINEQGMLEMHHNFSLDELKELAEKNGLGFESEPVDEKEVKDGVIIPGQWNVIFRKKELSENHSR